MVNFPDFKRGKTITRSVRLSEKMLKAAVSKAKREKTQTRGTFNSLVELLVWQYLGCPAEFIEEEYADLSSLLEISEKTESDWSKRRIVFNLDLPHDAIDHLAISVK